MATLRIERPCDCDDLDQAKRATEEYLVAIGYELTDEDDKRLTFKFTGGKWYATKLSNATHKLKVLFTGSSVRVEFGHWLSGEADLEKCREDFTRTARGIARAINASAERRAKKRAAKKLKKKPTGVRRHTIERQVVVVRCKYCGKLTPVDLEKCKSCGAPKFS